MINASQGMVIQAKTSLALDAFSRVGNYINRAEALKRKSL